MPAHASRKNTPIRINRMTVNLFMAYECSLTIKLTGTGPMTLDM